MCDAREKRIFVESERGFSLIEVLISIVITLIVMGAVFGLLTRGQRSFQREPEVADLQQSARTSLDLVARDILQGGAGLPPEFPAFSRINGAGDGNPTDVLEVIGTFQSAGNVYLEPEEVASLDVAGVVTLRANSTNLELDDPLTPSIDEGMVLLYNNVANVDTSGAGRVPQWALAQVVAVTENPGPPTNPPATITLNYGAYNIAYSKLNAVPPVPAEFAWSPPQQMPKITRVSVVRYFTQPDALGNYNGPPPEVLMRDMDFRNNPQAVGYIEDFEIRYVIGVTAPVEQDNPPDAVVDLAGVVLTSENMLSSVRVSITGRSVTAGLEGATDGALVGNRTDDFIRKTFSTNVNPRNVSAGIDIRTLTP
ncbi:MAG TPA: prepilin-type N-terminal cleavage/methylation domain-containing protein [Vicinamibacteria bacterium]|jgi:prepilin-type N-terminal cleavage/methylation domain-containing protein